MHGIVLDTITMIVILYYSESTWVERLIEPNYLRFLSVSDFNYRCNTLVKFKLALVFDILTTQQATWQLCQNKN